MEEEEEEEEEGRKKGGSERVKEEREQERLSTNTQIAAIALPPSTTHPQLWAKLLTFKPRFKCKQLRP